MRLEPRRHLVGLACLTMALTFGLAGCDSSDSPTGPHGPPSLTILFGGSSSFPSALGSAVLFAGGASGVKEAWVIIDDVCLQGVADGEAVDGNGRQCLLGEPTGWIQVWPPPETGDPTSEWETLVDGVEVPPGLAQLRFVINHAVIMAEGNGQESTDYVYATSDEALIDLDSNLEKHGDLHCPSCSRSGLKVIFPGGEPEMQDGQNMLLAQFDVSESFGKPRGNSGRWVMHPVLRGSLVERSGDISGTTSGAISGTVSVDQNATFGTDPLFDSNGNPLTYSCGGQSVDAAVLVELFRPAASNGQTWDAATNAQTGAYNLTVPAPATYDLEWIENLAFGTGANLTFSQVTVTDQNGQQISTAVVEAGQTTTVNYSILEVGCS